MPRRLGPRLDDLISRLPGRPILLQAGIIKTWPNLATGINVPNTNAWTEFITAAAAPASPFTVMWASHGSSIGTDVNPNNAIELGIGAAGSEVLIAATFVSGTGNGYAKFYPEPIIPGGTRVAVRVGATGGPNGKGSILSCLLPIGSLDPLNVLRQIPKMVPSGRGYLGTSAIMRILVGEVTAGTPLSTYGSYFEHHPATTETAPVIFMALSCTSFDNNFEGQMGIGYGALGAETLFLEFPMGYLAGGPGWVHTFELPVPILVPGSTRIAFKAACAVADGFGRLGFSVVKATYQP